MLPARVEEINYPQPMRRFSSFRDFDWTLLTLVLLMSVISVLEIRSATLHTKFRGFEERQVAFLLVGILLMFVISVIDYHRLVDIAPWLYGAGLLSLVAVKLVGTSVMGGKRWINLGGGVHFQPSEWVKLVLILAVARYFWGLAGRALTWTDIAKAFVMVGIPMYLVLKQPDLGTALTYLPVLLAGLFLGGIRLKQTAILLLLFAAVGSGAWLSGKRLKGYQQARINSFINPDTDPKGSGYQIKQSLIAVGSGGIWGKGTNKGTQTQGDFLPIPYTDFIFAAFCEEHGFVGGIGILLLYFLILTRLIQNAQQASDMPGTFIVMGVVAVVLFQIVVNIGMVVGLMPVTGIPLPLMSYGGSSILFTFLALGIVMNIRMRRFVN
jgi:rod shape determining protein RodA